MSSNPQGRFIPGEALATANHRIQSSEGENDRTDQAGDGIRTHDVHLENTTVRGLSIAYRNVPTRTFRASNTAGHETAPGVVLYRPGFACIAMRSPIEERRHDDGIAEQFGPSSGRLDMTIVDGVS